MDNNKYRVESTRLKNWDYGANGYYFVTICIKNRECVFGHVNKGEMILSEFGGIAEKFWREIPEHFPFVSLDVFIIMPNHVHGIVVIDKNDTVITCENVETHENVETQDFASLPASNNQFGPQSKNLASIVRGYKIGVKKWATQNNISFQWQPRFYDHIIRDEISLHNIRNYIIKNPLHWDEDQENPLGNKIDRIVYELYGFTEEEIKIVKGNYR